MYKRQIYQIAESNRIETFFARIGMLYSAVCVTGGGVGLISGRITEKTLSETDLDRARLY